VGAADPPSAGIRQCFQADRDGSAGARAPIFPIIRKCAAQVSRDRPEYEGTSNACSVNNWKWIYEEAAN
jgi:hypothetical protein